MKDHYQLELEAEEARQNVPHRLHARIGRLNTLEDLRTWTGVALGATMSLDLKKRLVK